METKRIAEDGAVGKNEDRLWRSMFAVQVALTEITTKKYNNRREQILAVVWSIVDGLQLLALVIGRFSGFDAGVTRPLLQWLDLHILFTQHSWDAFTKTFWVYFTATLYAILAFGYYALRQSKGKGRSVQVYMSMAARALLFGLFTPYLKLFASVFACGQDDLRPALPTDPASPPLFVCLNLQWTLYAAISGAVLGFFILFSTLYFFLFRHNHVSCPDYESRPHGRFHAAYALARIAMVAATIVVPSTDLIACLVSLACTAFPLYLHFSFLPSYKPIMNYVRGGFLASASCLALASCVLASVGRPGESSRALGSAVALAFAGFAFACGLALVWFRYWQAEKMSRVEEVDKLDLKTHFDAELAVRVLLLRDSSQPAVAKAEAMYRHAIGEFPTSPTSSSRRAPTRPRPSACTPRALANLLKQYGNNPNAAHAEIRIGWRKEPTVDYRYELHATKLFWERQAQVYSGGQGGQVAAADLFSSADAKKQYESARQSHTKTLKMTRQFWIQLTKKNLHVVGALDDVPRRLADIHQVALGAESAYVALIKRYGNSKILLRSYASFLEHCLNDKQRAQLYYMKADEVEESESKTASLSASQSQSQSQSAGGGGGGTQSASESQSASSGASSSAAAKKRAANKELRLRSNETKAVKRLFWGIVVGLLLLGGLACAMFIAVKMLFVEYSQNNSRLRFLSFQRRRVVHVNTLIRHMHLAALANNTEMFAHWASEVGIRAKDFSFDHRGLYFGYDDLGIPASTNPEIVNYWKTKNTEIVLHYPGPPIYEITEKQTIWDAGNGIMIMCRRVSLMPMEVFQGINLAGIRELKYVFQNAVFGILDALNVGAGIYEDDVIMTIEKAKYILLGICLFSCATLLCLAVFVFRPSFAKVRVTMRGMSDILEGIPRPLLKQIAKHYSKAQKRDREGDSEEEEEEEGGAKGANSSDSSRESTKSLGSDGAEDGGRQKSARRSKPSRRSRASGKGKEREEKEAASESSADEKEKKERRKGKRKEKGGSRKRGAAKKYEVEKSAGEASETTAAELEGPAESKRMSMSVDVVPAATAAAPAPAAARVSASSIEKSSADGAGSRGGSAGSRRASRPPSGSAAAAAAGPAVVGDLELEAPSSPEQGTLGVGGADTARSSEEPEAVLAIPELGDADEALVRILQSIRPASADSYTDKLKANSKTGVASAPASASSGHGAGSWTPDEEDQRKERRDRSASIQLTHKPRPTPLVRQGSNGGATGGILRKAAAEAAASADEDKPKAPAHHKRHAGGKEAQEGAEKSSSCGEEAKKDKKKKKDAEQKQKARRGDEGEKQGADILTKLTYKYTAAFFVIAGIFIVNFVVCFIILDAGKNYAYEINLSGRRRSIAREVAFYARELYFQGAIFLPRAEVFERLVRKAALLKEIHQALKFGNPELNVLGANGRNKQLDSIMYDPGCLRLDAAKCVDNRVEDMQLVTNGLDALVMGVTDLVVEIMQETTPDLLITGKEEAKYIKKNNFDIKSNKLDLIMEIDDGDLDDGLNRAAAAFVAESLTSMGVIETMEALILTFVILFLAGLYLYLFAPMLARLREETGRAGQILHMIPKDVVLKCVHLHHYFVGIGKEEDE
eukprot:tig00021522_g22100.t1